MSENDETKLKALMGNEFHETVEWTDDNNKKHTKTITLQDPGIGIATQIMDLINVGDDTSDYGSAFDLIMTNVLVNPRLNYGQLNNDLPEKLNKKTIIKKNNRGEDVKINLVFPRYRTALQLFMSGERPSGALNMHDTLESLNHEVLRTDEKTPQIVKMKYWDPAGHGYGLGGTAMSEATNYLGDILNRNGVLAILMKSFRFVAGTVRPK
ncbi:hypothetical protein YK48G_03950 [Lentilactobacillus fungorum]|uniref:Uncharacterized protein n=1 Tax=Lentilactobacillus fungorum TaxID=2201250 RepID=A0ABQ3VVR6_9LACO|nr:hypothetical protein [Lentilactobacillus fungorum]GHP12970.1 hypothetical protein YK48G_03950 [Lentilactobacillus fungorum]